MLDLKQANLETRQAWNTNATFWDERMGDTGNDFVNQLVWPAVQRLLDLRRGEAILDAGCGNGLYSRRLAEHGSRVVAFDFAEQLIDRARAYPAPQTANITYHVVDATDEAALLALGEQQFDAAISTMVLMDMAEIEPLFRALARLLRPSGRFVFAVSHPCFNQTRASHLGEMEDRGGEIVTSYALKIRGYLNPEVAKGAAIAGQPQAQLYFDRPLHLLFGAGFAAGFVVDGLEERAFAPDSPLGRNPLGWNGNFSEFPAVLVARMRLLKAG